MANLLTTRARWRRRSARGAATVELALSLPLLLLICLASVDCGRFAYAYIALSNAVRVAAEQGATQAMASYNRSSWENAVQTAAAQEMSGIPNFSSDSLTLTVSTTTTSHGLLQVTVEGQCPFAPIVAWPGVGQPVSLHRALCIRQFR